ncbi:YfhO family protein [bacterium]|nr:YfhO family protein [candidate division CSSED10-310 bacterium]
MAAMRGSRFSVWIIGFVLAVVVAILFDGVWRKGEVLYLLDIAMQNHPFQAYAFPTLLHGTVPLWCRWIGCGFALFAEGQSGVFYPPSILLHALLAPLWAITIGVLLHLTATGAFMYAFLRVRGASPVPALFAAVGWCGSTYFSSHYLLIPFFYTVAWLPLGLWGLERYRRQPGREIVFLAVLVAVQALAGHPPGLFICLVTYLLYAGIQALVTSVGGVAVRRVIRTAPALILGALLAAVQLIPTARLALASPRGEGLVYERMTDMSFPPRCLFSILVPGLFGTPADDSAWAVMDGYSWEFTAYPGMLVLLLAIHGVRVGPMRRRAPFLLLAVMGLLLMLGGYTPLYRMLALLPGADFFRIPARFALLFMAGLAGLAALGLEDWRQRGGRVLTGPVLVVAVGLVLVFVPNALFALRSDRAEFYTTARFLRIEAAWARAVLLAAALLILALVIDRLVKQRPRMALGLGLVVVLADLRLAALGFTHTMPSAMLSAVPGTVATLSERGIEGNTISLVDERSSTFNWHKGWLLSSRSYAMIDDLLFMYSPVLHGIEGCSLNGWSPLHPAAMQRLQSRLSPGVLRLLGVNAVITTPDQSLPGMRRSAVHEDYTLQVTEPPASRESFGWRLQWETDRTPVEMAELAVLQPPGVLYTSARVAAGGGVSGGMATRRWTGANRFDLSVDCRAAGALLLAQQFDPGWRFSSAAADIAAVPVNGALTALLAVPGEVEVEACYEPISYRLGLFVTIVSTAGLIMATVGRRRAVAWKVQVVEIGDRRVRRRLILCLVGCAGCVVWGMASCGWYASLRWLWLWKCHVYSELLSFL